MLARLSVLLRAWLLMAALKLPTFLVAPLGFGVRSVEGQPVSARLRWFLRLLFLEPPSSSAADKRAIYDAVSDSHLAGPRLGVQTRDHVVEGTRVRSYRPHGAGEALPGIFWIHGGGWVIGSITSHDRFCRRLCAEAGVVVIAADYDLAPEHPFPGPEASVTRVWRWLRANAGGLGIDPARLSLGGDSAGGNLTTVLCQRLPREQRPTCQILCYPSADMSRSSPSRERWGHGYLLTRPLMDWCTGLYCRDADRSDPRLSPLLAPALEGQPPALVITAGMDPLLDEGRAYGDRLQASGTPVERLHYPAIIHGFLTLCGALPEAEEAVAEVIRRLRERLHGAWSGNAAPAPEAGASDLSRRAV